MGAPIGNNFWEARAKHGRDEIFEDPEILWEESIGYFIWVKENPLQEQDWVGKDGNEVSKDKMRAMSIAGLCLYLGVNSRYFYDLEDRIKGKKDQRSKDFSHVITRIKDTLNSQKFEGAAAGLLNANIISRDLGLVDKTQNEHAISATDKPSWLGESITNERPNE